MDRRARLSAIPFALGVALAVLAPLAVHWLAGKTLVWWDSQSTYAPQRWLVDEALRAFRLPLWNPHMGAGVPFLADAIHGVLHPVSVVTAWLGTGRSVDVLIGGYVLCAGLGAAWLARELGASRPAAALAAVAYAASGHVLSMAGNLPYLAGAGTLPFCAAGLRRIAAEPGPAGLALGALGTAALALSGDAQALALGGLLGLALAFEATGWRGAARAAAAGAVGLLVAGVQLVPSVVHLFRSERAEALWTRTPAVWALAPWRLPELVLPGLSSGPDPAMDRVFAALAGPERWPEGEPPSPFSASAFLGLLPLALAVAGARARRPGRLLALAALGFLWIALGPTLGADAVLGNVPIWRAFRYPEKLLGPLALAVAVLAALGLDAVRERRASGVGVLAAGASLAVAAIGAGALAASRLPPDLAAEASARVLRGAWHVLAALLALGAWLLARERLGRGREIALAAAVWCAAGAASPAALRPGDPEARLSSPGPSLDGGEFQPRVVTPYTAFGTPVGARDPFDAVGAAHAALGYPAYHVRARLDSLSEHAAMVPRRLRLLLGLGKRWPVAARRFGLTHVLVHPPLTVDQAAAHALATRDGAVVEASGEREVWAVPHRAWASFAEELWPADEALALDALGLAMLEGSPAVVVETKEPLGTAPGRVLAAERGLESLRVEAVSAGPATLVVADAWWPGWEATIDGAPAAIVPADVLARAVRWPPGRHVLEMRYRPPEVAAGLALSAAGLALLAAGMVLLRRQRIPRPLSPAGAGATAEAPQGIGSTFQASSRPSFTP